MSGALNIFDPRHYEKVRRPPLEAETLPTWCYTSAEFFDREVETIFRKVWNFIGRTDELPQPGDFKCFELFGESVIVLRDKAGALHAFVNTCRHRGTRMLAGDGNCPIITCPYHGWAFALTGELVATPGMEQTVDFHRADYGLVELRLATWAGFIFVSFEAQGIGLEAYLGNLPAVLASHNLDDVVCIRRKEYDLACNWKIYLENAAEDYHTPMVHRRSIGKQTTFREPTTGAWDALYMPAPRTIALLPEDIDQALPAIPTLDAKAAAGTYFVVLYPATFFVVTQDCMWWLQQFPLAAGRTKVVIGSCFPREVTARPDFAAKVESYYRRWDKSLGEDNAISEQQQQGVQSAFSVPGRLSFHESAVRDIANWVLDRVVPLPA